MADDKQSPWGEEYLPTVFHDRDGREYVIHVNVIVLQEVSRRHSLTLQDLLKISLPMHILLTIAEIGTRYMWFAKHKQSEQAFLESLNDENVVEAIEAAQCALINFSLRGNRKLSHEERRGLANIILEQARRGDGEMSTDLREQLASIRQT
jgi:hypothetical protein